MTNTYTTRNLANNTVTLTGTGSSGSGYTVATGIGINTVSPLTVGQVYTTNSTSNLNWANSASEVMKINQTDPPTIEVKGNLVINGVDLDERLKTIENVLMIPERDVKLEKKHPKLKEMYDAYIQALGKYRTWETLKGEDDVT
jgi:hypothetical protein